MGCRERLKNLVGLTASSADKLIRVGMVKFKVHVLSKERQYVDEAYILLYFRVQCNKN